MPGKTETRRSESSRDTKRPLFPLPKGPKRTPTYGQEADKWLRHAWYRTLYDLSPDDPREVLGHAFYGRVPWFDLDETKKGPHISIYPGDALTPRLQLADEAQRTWPRYFLNPYLPPTVRGAYESPLSDIRAIGLLLNRIDLPWAPDQPRFVSMLKSPSWLKDRYRAWLRKMLPKGGVRLGAGRGHDGRYQDDHDFKSRRAYLDFNALTYGARGAMPYIYPPQDATLRAVLAAGVHDPRAYARDLEANLRTLLAAAKYYELAGTRHPHVWEQAKRIPVSYVRPVDLGHLLDFARTRGITPDSPNYNPGKSLVDELFKSQTDFDRRFAVRLIRPSRDAANRLFLETALYSSPGRGVFYSYPMLTPRQGTWRPKFWSPLDTNARVKDWAGKATTLMKEGPYDYPSRRELEREYNMPLPALHRLWIELQKYVPREE